MFKILTYKAFSSSHQLAINILREIGVFVEANPSKIVTIIIEDYVRSPNSINKVFDAAGLRNLWFSVSQIPKSDGEWATIADMVQHNQRLVVFTSMFAKESSEGIASLSRRVTGIGQLGKCIVARRGAIALPSYLQPGISP
ncbi:PI-PLC X domain-containing protein [Capsicum baccatum]|uniref:PI-PLC X domain-containing protein n=1 Tax=Capsicum baccatum TaxID=33114 RepID=A0A2G2VTJ2_CAPBA|nr:PI-PLC X domain-containing protein [Capsicum baccatum]